MMRRQSEEETELREASSPREKHGPSPNKELIQICSVRSAGDIQHHKWAIK
jgi:hypothetical protein